jgi:hypothetical protein
MQTQAERKGRMPLVSAAVAIATTLMLMTPPASAAGTPTTAGAPEGPQTALTHEWNYDGPFLDPWTCKAYGNFGIDVGWWAGWMCIRSGLFGPYLLWVRSYH